MSRYAGQEPRRYNLMSENFTVTTAGQTTFTLSYNPGSPDSILVHVNGVFARANDAFGTVGKNLTFTYGLNVNDVVNVKYLGILSNTYPVNTLNSSVRGSFSGLALSATGVDTNVSVSATSIALKNAVGQYITVDNVNLNLVTSASGVNGLDTGATATSTWYYVFIISDGTNVGTLASLSATAPTLPGAYTYWARIGSFRTDGTVNKYPLAFRQYGRKVRYIINSSSNVTGYPLVVIGVSGTTTSLTPFSLTTFVPPPASHVELLIQGPGSMGLAMVASSPEHNGGTLGSKIPQLSTGGSNSTSLAVLGTLMLESTNVYYYGETGSNSMRVVGWEDNL